LLVAFASSFVVVGTASAADLVAALTKSKITLTYSLDNGAPIHLRRV